MPITSAGALRIEHFEQRSGPAIVLLHSSASGARQWQALTAALVRRRRVIAPNLMGYGATSPWPGPRAQTIADQAALALAALADVEGPIDMVGHSFGALIALELAWLLGPLAGRLAMYEPNPFALLDVPGLEASWREVTALHALVAGQGRDGDRWAAAAGFVDFFSGPGAWAAMPEIRRAALADALGPNRGEWDAVMDRDLRVIDGRWCGPRRF
jgi:pimeloyl-ACP methyl ester carboxylesterase